MLLEQMAKVQPLIIYNTFFLRQVMRLGPLHHLLLWILKNVLPLMVK